MSEEEKKETGFQVKDRRRFTDGGDPRPEEKQEPPAAPPPKEVKKPEKRPSGEKESGLGKEEEPDASAPFPVIDFSTFVFSLSSSVLIHLGLAPDPLSGEQRKELALAKQTIDILGMIQEKTRGNLTEEEKRMMDGILYDLRLRYVQESKKK